MGTREVPVAALGTAEIDGFTVGRFFMHNSGGFRVEEHSADRVPDGGARLDLPGFLADRGPDPPEGPDGERKKDQEEKNAEKKHRRHHPEKEVWVERMTFRDYMEWSLSDPGRGYYTRSARIGFDESDFYTAPELSPAFSLLLSRQMVELDAALNHPNPFYLMEAGPGNGTLMTHLLASLRMTDPNLFHRMRPILYEISPVLRERQRKRLSRIDGICPDWIDPSDPDWDRREPFRGVIFGNEFLDALPAHRLKKIGGEIREIYVVAREDGSFIEETGPLSSPLLVEGIFSPPPDLQDGFEWEATPDMCVVLDRLDRILDSGFMLWVDYGDTVREKFSPRKAAGTVMGYRYHKAVDKVLSEPPGAIDLTVHVDFTLLYRHLSKRGYAIEGFTDQTAYLTGLGIESLFGPEEGLSEEERQSIATLIHPLRMGRIFKAMLLSKGEVGHLPWSGFRSGTLTADPDGRPG